MALSLIFINRVGKTIEGRYEYTLYYSEEPENVWAEDYSEQVPSICKIETLLPEEGTYSVIRKGISDNDIYLAQDNSCFSFQDCIDGVIQLAWSYNETGDYYYGIPYGADVDTSDQFLEKVGMTLGDFTEIDKDRHNETEQEKDFSAVFGPVGTNIDVNNLEIGDEEDVKETEGDDDYLEKIFNGEV